MKKIRKVMVAGVIVLTLSSCGQTKNLEDDQVNIESNVTKNNDNEDKDQGMKNDNMAGLDNTNLDKNLKGEGQIGSNKGESDLDKGGDTDSIIEEELENLTGEYDYLSDYGTGRLIIQKTSDGYDISDYESESSYRFLADSSNIETIENNSIYIKYPEQVLADDTVIFSYYILEYSGEEIKMYYKKSLNEDAQFLYYATKKREEDSDK